MLHFCLAFCLQIRGLGVKKLFTPRMLGGTFLRIGGGVMVMPSSHTRAVANCVSGQS